MTNWRAVGIGFVVELVLSVFFVIAGIIGGFVAGYIAGGGLGNGFWHGLLAGAIGGVIVAIIVGLFGSAVLGVMTGGFGILAGLGVTVIAVVLFFVISIPSAIGGLVGAAVT